MGFIVGGKGKWSTEARRESFYLTYTPDEESSKGQVVMEPLYGDYQDLLDTLKMLTDYLKSPAAKRAYGDRLAEGCDTKMTETEHHGHRTDEEWRAKIRGWVERGRKDTLNMTQYLYPDLIRVFNEMEKETGPP